MMYGCIKRDQRDVIVARNTRNLETALGQRLFSEIESIGTTGGVVRKEKQYRATTYKYWG